MSNRMKRKRKIALPLLLLALAALAVSGWQLWAAARERADSGAQARMKPETQPGDLMDFTGLREQNPDIIAWLTISGLGIDYPVVQGTDNSYYLSHTAEGKPNKLGALFLDFRDAGDFTDFNSVIYGHYIKSGEMFRNLSLMREPEWFGRVTQGLLYTPGKTYRLEFFAAALAGSKSDFYQYAFPSPASRAAHLEMVRAGALQYRDIGVTNDDRLLCLSTCSYEYEGARTLVIARID